MTEHDKEAFRRSIRTALAAEGDDAWRRAVDALVDDGWTEVVRSGELATGETLRTDWTAALANQAPSTREAAAAALLAERRLTRARARAYKLGCETIDRARPQAQLQLDAATLETELVTLRPALDAAPDAAWRQRLARQLQEALLDLEYVAEEKAMSERLGRYRDSRTR